jgi:dolichol-phosphate mannosyltransferase
MPEHATIVLIPTYNERQTVPRLLGGILSNAGRVEGALNILVLDDNSPDGTAAVVEEASRRDPCIEVRRRPGKAGLGAAYQDGFRFALSRRFDRIVTMDGDLSHDPAAIPELIAECADCDLVIGSRYVPGGQAPGLSRFRQLVSTTANRLWGWTARGRIRDLTSGFRCYRADSLATVLQQGAVSTGYASLTELALRFLQRGLRVKEVPIVFGRRAAAEGSPCRALAQQCRLEGGFSGRGAGLSGRGSCLRSCSHSR